jgi:MOSC domain-containing protein YiiM
LGENITTSNIDLFSLSAGALLHFGNGAVVKITGLREPTKRLDEWPDGLLDNCKIKDEKGDIAGRRIGVYASVEREGYVKPGDEVWVENPEVFKALRVV